DFPNAETAFEALFEKTALDDARLTGMLAEARSTFIKVENISANNRQEESLHAVTALRRHTEKVSGYPFVDTDEPLPQHIGAKIRMAWKHDRDHHQLILRRGDYPEILKHHLQAHEFYHVILES